MASVGNVVIVGGGISGLALAVGLQKSGVDVRIVEKGDRSSRLGTGICLLGNALKALERIGMADACIAVGFGYDLVRSLDGAGNMLNETPMPRSFRADRPSAFGVMRPLLAETLEAAAVTAGARIDFETVITDIQQDANGVDLVLSTGETVRTDLLVGADGVYSATRSAIFPDAPKPEYCGQGGIRYTAPRPKDMNGITFYRTADAHGIGAIPLSDEICYYFMLLTGDRPGLLDPAGIADTLRKQMEPLTAPELVSACDALGEDSPISYRPFDALMLPRPWHSGRVVLIGDAVHSVTPQLTSGGGMALEDAVILCELLNSHADVASALTAFEERREPRVRAVFDTTMAICKLEQDPSPDAHQQALEHLNRGYRLISEPF